MEFARAGALHVDVGGTTRKAGLSEGARDVTAGRRGSDTMLPVSPELHHPTGSVLVNIP